MMEISWLPNIAVVPDGDEPRAKCPGPSPSTLGTLSFHFFLSWLPNYIWILTLVNPDSSVIKETTNLDITRPFLGIHEDVDGIE
jgi:hypothetical protein